MVILIMRSQPLTYMRMMTCKGKLLTCSIHGRMNDNVADVQLFCVGKPKGTTYFKRWVHTPSLAPSKDLVTYTKMHKRGDWFKNYTENLIDEWQNSQEFLESFSRLISLLSEGKTVAVACYCHTHKRSVCHLSILADLVKDFGFEVEELPMKKGWENI